MTKKKLFLHVGAGKCASTSIQGFIFDNTQALNSLGIAVSDAQLNFGGIGDNPLWLIEDMILGKKPNIIADKLNTIKKPNAVIAAENLQNIKAPYLFAGLSDFEIHVLVMIRRQDDWIYSSWKQWHSKTGRSLEQYVDVALMQHEPNFPAIVDAWVPVAASVTVESLDLLGDRTIPDVVLSWLGLSNEKDRFSYVDAVHNESFDFRILDLLSRHSAVYDGPHDLGVESFLTEYSALSAKQKFRLSDELCDKVMEAYHADNAKLLGDERAMRLQQMRKKDREVARSGLSLESHDFLLACLLEAMNKMASKIEDLQKQLSLTYKARYIGDELVASYIQGGSH